MNDELTELRTEVATLRTESNQLRSDLNRVMRLLGIYPPVTDDEEWPKMLSLEVESLAIRDPDNPLWIPIHLRAFPEMAFLYMNDPKNRTRFEVQVTEAGATLEVYNADRNPIITLRETEAHNPQMSIATPDGKPCAGLQIKDGRAMVNIVDEKNRSLVLLHAEEAGGEIIVGNRNGQPATTVKATSLGGLVTVHEPGGQLMGSLLGTSDTGALDVRGPQGAVAVGLISGELSGAMLINDAEGQPVAIFPPALSPGADDPDSD